MAPIYCATMSIKSDRWIRRMAHQHRMIEPFADDPARGGVISYGVSSYGYDMPRAPAFKIYANEGIAQVLFFTADEGDECEVSYADKKGKYQAQRGITLPKL